MRVILANQKRGNILNDTKYNYNVDDYENGNI